MKFKKELAFEIVKELNNEATADKAQTEFERTFQKKGLPGDLPAHTIKKNSSCTLIDVLVDSGLVNSKAEAKRQIQQGAVEVNGTVIREPKFKITTEGENVIKVGKLKYLKVIRFDF